MPTDSVTRAADTLARSGVAIMSHGPGGATIPPLKLLREHGVEVFGGSDNIRDAWSPFGNGDMLERAMLIGYRANFRHDEELALAFDMVTAAAARVLGLDDYGLKVGGPADFVTVEATTLAEAVANRRRRSLVVKAGRVVAAGWGADLKAKGPSLRSGSQMLLGWRGTPIAKPGVIPSVARDLCSYAAFAAFTGPHDFTTGSTSFANSFSPRSLTS